MNVSKQSKMRTPVALNIYWQLILIAPITAITLTPEEKYVISASSDKSICTIDLDDAKVIHKLDGSGSNNSTLLTIIPLIVQVIINCMAMASKIPKLIAGCIDGSIRIFDRKVMNLEHIICDAHTGNLFIPDPRINNL